MRPSFVRAALLMAALWLLPAGLPSSASAADAAPNAQRKTVPARQYLYSRHPLAAVEDITRIEWVQGPRLLRQLKALGLEAAGGLEYHVTLAAPMRVDVAVPVAQVPAGADPALFKTTAPFDCLALRYTGSPLNLAGQWALLQQEVEKRGLAWTRENREVLVSREGFDAMKHVTELQAGVREQGRAGER